MDPRFVVVEVFDHVCFFQREDCIVDYIGVSTARCLHISIWRLH